MQKSKQEIFIVSSFYEKEIPLEQIGAQVKMYATMEGVISNSTYIDIVKKETGYDLQREIIFLN